MKKLEVTVFVRFYLAVALQVTRMDESLRCKGPLIKAGGFSIESKLCPDCASDTLYVRGSDSCRDLDLATINFATEPEKDAWIAKCKAAVRALNEGEPEQPTGGVEVWS